MRRWHATVVAAAASVMVAAMAARAQEGDAGANALPLRPDDAVEAYLERLGAARLRAEQLSLRLATAAKEERVVLAERLGKLYVQLLTDAKTAEDRGRWEQRGRDLLRDHPEADTSELRLSLNKAVYSQSEETAEKARLRLATPVEAGEAEKQLRSLVAEFETIAGRANQRVLSLERVEKTGEATDQLSSELASARRVRSLGYYYAGWCHVYISMLSGNKPNAVEALKCFGWLLNAPQGRAASPDRMPTALLKYDHIARSAIGCAVACGLRGEDGDAVRWLDMIAESDEISEPIREQILLRRIAVLGDAKRWADLDFLLRRERKADRTGGGKDLTPLAVRPARLLAVVVLEADRRVAGSEIEGLARIAMGDLVARQEVGQVLDLVRRYGTAPIGDRGFIVFYVRGLLQYDKARAAHRAAGGSLDDPSTDPATVAIYRESAVMLQAALNEADAAIFVEDQGAAAVNLGRALFFAGDVQSAGEKFAEAWSLLAGAAAKGSKAAAAGEEALWLAVLAMDRGAGDGKNAVAAARRAELATMFLQAYPGSSRAARIVLMQAAGGDLSDDEAVRILSDVPKDSPVYEASRRQLARLLYSKYRASRGNDRDFAAMRFVGVAEELLASDRRIALDPDAEAAKEACDRIVVRARQLLDALLGVSSPDISRASAVLEALQSVAAFNKLDLTEHQAELTFRRVQIALATGQEQEAAGLIERLWSMGAAGEQFAHAADRLLYRRAAARWKQSSAVDDARLVVRLGKRLVTKLGSGPAALTDPAVAGVYATVAAAAARLAEEGGDDATEHRELSIRLDEAILAAQPRTEESLRRLAATAEQAGDVARAAECWGTMFAATPQGSATWFEARYHSLRLMARVDVKRARDGMAQHRLLFPEFGPPPWGARIRALNAELEAAPVVAPKPEPSKSATSGLEQGGSR